MNKEGEILSGIEALDREILERIRRRAEAMLAVSANWPESERVTHLLALEAQLRSRREGQDTAPLTRDAVEAVFREVVSAMLSVERKVVVAYLGPPATFTHQAARQHFGAMAEYRDCETITDVFEAVEKKVAKYGVVPIENSTEGAVTHTLDEFVATPLKICAEIYLPVAHHLMAKVPIDRVRRIYSKPEVFGQCRRWLHENMPGVELVPVSSTARGAEMAASEDGAAALASDLAAELYGLNILARDVQDMAGNTTRFLVIGETYPPPTGQDKTSIFFAVKHRVGALHDALSTFKLYGINMTKIESRPSKTRAWEYYFFVDIEGHAEEQRVKKALEEMAEHCTLMRVLGAYPRVVGGAD